MGIAVVAGANRGIGLALVRQLRARGVSVIAVCRRSSSDLDRLGVRIESGIDLASPKAGVELAARLAREEISLLIYSAGLLIEDTLGSVRADDVRAQLEINALAPLFLTQALTPLLARGAKVALITSRMGSIGDNTSGGYYGYRMSKAALNAAGVSMARDLAPRGVSVVILHPGAVRTGMTGGQGILEPDESVSALLCRIDELQLETTGRFLHQNGDILPW
ncbi:MAG TPA: SDR family oxidoreductase [Candidatus Krumholzibacteria bacterium]|nr:SDR family oxidoreductase [Candidatus Krumholzibacteria bacterium]